MRELTEAELELISGGLSASGGSYSSNEDIVVTGTPYPPYYPPYYPPTGYPPGYYPGGSPPPPYGGGGGPTNAQTAHNLADSIVSTNGTLTAEQTQMVATIEAQLEKAILSALDKSNFTVTNENGDAYTKAQLISMFNNIKIVAGTQDLGTNNLAAALSNDQRTIKIDLDSRNFTDMVSVFGSSTEALNFAVFHEIGHYLDNQFSGTRETDLRARETEASNLADKLMGVFGLDRPTTAEVNRWYNS